MALHVLNPKLPNYPKFFKDSDSRKLADLVSFPRQVRFTVQRTGAALRSQAGGQAPSANAKIRQRGRKNTQQQT